MFTPGRPDMPTTQLAHPVGKIAKKQSEGMRFFLTKNISFVHKMCCQQNCSPFSFTLQ